MTLALWNLAAYSAQLAVLAITAAAAASLLRLDAPRVAVRYWQVVIAAGLALPLLQSWSAEPNNTVQASIRFISSSTESIAGESRPLDAATIVLAVLVLGIVLRLGWLGAGHGGRTARCDPGATPN